MRHLVKGLLLATFCATPAVAQKSRLLHLIVIRGAPADGAPTEIRLLRGPASENVIVVGRKATAVDLEAAVEVVKRIRAQVGDTLSKDVRAVARLSSRADPRKGTPEAKRRDSMRDALSALDRKAPEDRPGHGWVKALDMLVERADSTMTSRPLAKGRPEEQQ